jgi:hypothetical protein
LSMLNPCCCSYNRDAILSFYRWIWTLFYLEYAMFPFI